MFCTLLPDCRVLFFFLNKMNKLLSLPFNILPEFLFFFFLIYIFFFFFFFFVENLNNELKRGHENEVRADDRKLKINFATPNIPTKCIN